MKDERTEKLLPALDLQQHVRNTVTTWTGILVKCLYLAIKLKTTGPRD